MRDQQRSAVITGAVFVVLGVVFLLDQLEVITLRVRFIWPVLLILLGVAIIFRAPRGAR